MATLDTATARATVTVDIRVSGSWGANCTIGQLQQQASEAAKNAVTRALQNVDGTVIGDVQITSIIHIQPKERR